MLTQKQMRRSGRRMVVAALALGLGAGMAGAQATVEDRNRAVTKAPKKQELVYRAAGGFAAVKDLLALQSDGRLMASREFLGRNETVWAYVQPEEAAALIRRFHHWDPIGLDRGEKSEMSFEVTLRQGNKVAAKSASRADEYLARLQELHRKALDGELAEPGAIEVALPFLPKEGLIGFTLREDKVITWEVDKEGQRIESGRRKLTRQQHDRLKSALDVTEGEIEVDPTASELSALRVFEVMDRPREDDRDRSALEEEGSREEVILPVRHEPKQDGGPIRMEAVLRMIRG